MKYRKKPVVIEAVRYMIDDSLPDWFMDRVSNNTIMLHEDGTCHIKTLEGTMKSEYGDYIIRGVNGEVYPCKPDIFQKTYVSENTKDGQTGRLIDAGKILDNLSGMLKNMEDYDAVRKVINDMQTAYDVDVVVKQLDEYITKLVGRKSALYQTVMQIVKGGGGDNA